MEAKITIELKNSDITHRI